MVESLPGHLPKGLGTWQWWREECAEGPGWALPHPFFTKWPQCATSSAEDTRHVEMSRTHFLTSREIDEKPVITPSTRGSNGGGRGHSGSSRWASNLAGVRKAFENRVASSDP